MNNQRISTDGNNDDLESTGTGVNSQISSTAHNVIGLRSPPSTTQEEDVVHEGLMPMPSLQTLITGRQGALPHTALHADPVQRRMMTVINTND